MEVFFFYFDSFPHDAGTVQSDAMTSFIYIYIYKDFRKLRRY
jgi:hypothetical protein